MKAMLRSDGRMQLYPSNRAENHDVQGWYEDWRNGRARLELVTYRSDGTFLTVQVLARDDQQKLNLGGAHA